MSGQSVIETLTAPPAPASLDRDASFPVHLFGTPNGLFERHLSYDNVIEQTAADSRDLRALRDALLTHGDYYMHLADLTSYVQAQQRLGELYRDPRSWARKAILNIAGSGKFLSHRTIAEYASDVRSVSLMWDPRNSWKQR